MAAQSVICVVDGLVSFASQRLKNGRRMSPSLLDWKEGEALLEAHIDMSSPVEHY